MIVHLLFLLYMCIHHIFILFYFHFFFLSGLSLSFIFSCRPKSPAGVFPRQKPLALITRVNSPKNSRPSRRYYIYQYTSYCSAHRSTACANGVAPHDFYNYTLYRPQEFNIILQKNGECERVRQKMLSLRTTSHIQILQLILRL